MVDRLKVTFPKEAEIASVVSLPRNDALNDVERSTIIARRPEADEAISKAPRQFRGGTPDERYESLSFEKLFGNANPVEIEIGSGRGKFLVARSQANSGINFIGIDRAGRWMKRGIKRAGNRKLSNIRFIKGEARRFLTEAILPESVTIFHIYFPDPWPKRRHHERRVVNAGFLRLLHSRLLSGGHIEIATDDADYFTAMKRSIAATVELWENVRETQNERILGGEMKTNYELKFEAEGRHLFYVELIKR